jgi:CBS domain-containing protein
MHVSDILRVKGHTLYTVPPEQPLAEAIQTMVERDIGSLVVMEHGRIAGILTFREVLQALVKNGGEIGVSLVRDAMEVQPLTCTPETEIDAARRLMLGRHARYMPVIDENDEGGTLMGVISFHDIAKAVVEAQDFENRMLKAYIRDWPEDEDGKQKDATLEAPSQP